MQVEDLLVCYVYSEECGIVKFGIRNTTTQGNFLGRDKRIALEDRLKLTVPCGTIFCGSLFLQM